MQTADPLTAAGRAKLAAARILLHETQGFLYLPVLVQTQVVAAAALAHLLADWQGVTSFAVAWPNLPAGQSVDPEATAETEAAARSELLANLDHAIAVQAKGAILVLDASPSDRHRLAVDSISYLNQRREALRKHQLRLILLWPASEAQALMSGAPDLWSMRALAPVLETEDLASNNAAQLTDTPEIIEPLTSPPANGLSPLHQRQWQRWLDSRDLHTARLSTNDALTLIDRLSKQGEWPAAAELCEGILRQLGRQQENDLPARAAALAWLSLARSRQGDRQGALAPAQESVGIYEKLAAENFAAYAPDLAGSLNNLSTRLSKSGDRVGGLATIRRAVEIQEQLAAENFAAYTPGLAGSLNNLSNRLSESGDRVGGLATIRRAVEIQERLAAENFAAYAPDLAGSLNNLSNRLSENGDRVGGLATIRRAVEIQERLAAENFAAYAPDLAVSLNNLSIELSESGDRVGGLAAVERAIELITQFAKPGTIYADWLSTMQRRRKSFE